MAVQASGPSLATGSHGGGSHGLVGRGLLPPWSWLHYGRAWGRVWHPHTQFLGDRQPRWGTDSPTGGQGGGQPVATRAWGGGRRAVVAKLVETAPGEAQDL